MFRKLAPVAATLTLLAGCGGGTPKSAHRAPVAAQCPGYITAYGCQAHSQTFGLQPAGRLTLTAPTSTPTVEMRDSVTVSAIPAGTRAVAGYTSGSWPTFRPLVAAFPRAFHVSIAVNAGQSAKCLDVEPGDAVPSQAGPWDRQQLARGIKPCDYASLANMPAVKASIAASLGAGWRALVLLWDANWTFSAHLDAGFDCTQWTDHGPQGQNYDESTCARSFFGPVPHPGPSAATVRRWRTGRDASFAAYHARGCKLALTGECGQLGFRVRHFQGKLWTVSRRWACFGRRARTGTAVCWVVRPTTAWRARARNATAHAQILAGCFQISVQRPANPRVCRLLNRRYEHFAALVRTTIREYR